MAYKTGWVKKLINGVSTKIFAYAHAKTVYTDYANGTTLDKVLIETEDFDQSAVEESEISPVILSKLNSLATKEDNNFTLLNANKAEAADTYSKEEVDNMNTSFAKGGGLTLGVTDEGILTVTYDDGQQKGVTE